MARRLFRGREFSENGWPYVDAGSCTWVRIPGAQHVSLQIQNGPPLQILRAFAADFHAHVEPLRDPDSACWTPDNSVATSNHPGGTACFSGDTEILTIDGPRRIADLAGTDVEILTADPFAGGRGRWVFAPIRSFGVQNTRTVILSRHGRRKVVRATDDHRWLVRRMTEISYALNGQRRRAHRERVEEVTTAALRPGDTLCTTRPRAEAAVCQPSPFGVAAGIVFGDGSVNTSNRMRAGAYVDLIGAKEELLRFFPEPRCRRYPYDGGDYLQVDNLPRRFKELPSTDESTGYLLGWLAGLIATDGHVGKDGSVSIKTAHEVVAEFIRSICPRLGIGARVAARKRDLNQGSLAEGVDYTVYFEKATLDSQLFVRSDQREAFGQIERGPVRWRVESVTDGLTEEVFCATVDGTRAFCLDEFILTGNCDLNWQGADGKTFRYGISKERAYPGDKARKLDELLDFYEGVVFCGGEWSIRDWMHFQLGAGTYDQTADRPTTKTTDFIARKIRPDGFSTYRRGGNSSEIPMSSADVLARATGLPAARAAEILPAVTSGLLQSDCSTPLRIAMWLAQCGHESDNFAATEEYQSGPMDQERWIYKGRTWIQLTWRSAYEGFGRWCHARGLVNDPNVFVANPRKLADLEWAGLGAAYYWTTTRRPTRKYPTLNEASDAGDVLVATLIVNGGTNGLEDTQNGPGRRTRYQRALALGDQLLALTAAPDTPTTQSGDDMAAVPQDQWDRVYRELTQPHYSRSPLRRLGEGTVDTWAGMDLNDDSHGHLLRIKSLAEIGHAPSLALLAEVAGADPRQYPDRQEDAALARQILTHIEATNPAVLQTFLATQKGN